MVTGETPTEVAEAAVEAVNRLATLVERRDTQTYTEGHDDGYEDGYKDGKRDGRADLEPILIIRRELDDAQFDHPELADRFRDWVYRLDRAMTHKRSTFF